MTVTFWRADPSYRRLSMQPSWGRLLKTLSLEQGVSVDTEISHVYGGYRAEIYRYTKEDRKQFLSEGYGAHPLGAIRDALTGITPIKPRVRSQLLEALIDYLIDEIGA